MRNRTGHWEVTAITNRITVKLCNLADFIRKYNYDKMNIYNQISKARREKKDSTIIDGWKIGWFYNYPLESLEKLVINSKTISSPIIIKKKERKKKNGNYKNSVMPELAGRLCYN